MGQKETSGLGKYSGLKRGVVTLGLSATMVLSSCQAVPPEIYHGNQSECVTSGYVEREVNENGRYCIFLIDMQPLFLEEIDEEELKNEMRNQIEVLKYAQKNKIPIFVLEYGNEGCETTQKLKDVLSKSPYELIIKSDDNGFEGTSLNSKLEEYGITDMVLMGVNSCSCVRDTAIGAMENSYEIITSPDVIAQSKGGKEFFKTGECIEWYEGNGLVFENHSELINYLKENEKKD